MIRRVAIAIVAFLIAATCLLQADEPDRKTTPALPPYLTPRTTSQPTNTPTQEPLPQPIRYGYLEGKIFDNSIKRLVAARVEIRGASGELVGGSVDGAPYWGEGHFRLKIPVGLYRFVASRGQFYIPCKNPPFFQIEDGKVTSIEMPLTPWGASRKNGWHAFDPLVYTACGKLAGPVPCLRHLALLSEAEGLDFVNAAAPWWFDPPPNIEPVTDPVAIAALANRVSSDMLKVGTTVFTDKRPYFGWFYTVGARTPREIELPDDTGYPNAVEMARLRATGAAVILHNPARRRSVRPATSRWAVLNKSIASLGELFPIFEGYASELPYDLSLGVVDAIDIQEEEDMAIWFTALNRGYRISALKSSGTRIGATPNSYPRPINYAQLRGASTVAQLSSAITAGRIVVAEGPFIDFSIDNQPPGSLIPSDGRDHFAAMRFTAPAGGDFTVATVRVIRNGTIIQTSEGLDNPFSTGETIVERSFRIRENDSAWYIVMAADSRGKWSFTNPIYFRKPGEGFSGYIPVPKTITVNVTSAIGTRIAATVSLVDGNAVLRTAAQSADGDSPAVIEFANRLPPSARIVVSADGYTSQTFSVFGKSAFAKCIKNWCHARENTPLLSNPDIYDELAILARELKLDVKLSRE